MRRFILLIPVGVVALAVAACGPTTDGKPTGQAAPPPPPVDTGPKHAGRVVYDSNGCAKCHTVDAMGGPGGPPGGPPGGFPGGPPGGGGPGGPPGGGGGPGGPPGGGGGPPMPPGGGGPGGPPGGGYGGGVSLAKIGGSHDKKWIIAHIRDPQADKPQSKMPKFGEDRINAKDMEDLGDYLAGLK